MIQVLIVANKPMAFGPFVTTGDAIVGPDMVIPKSVAPDWHIVSANIPSNTLLSNCSYDGTNVVVVPSAPFVEVPEFVAMWQARSVMIADGILAAVVAALAGISDPIARAQAQAKFEYSSTVRRDDPLVKNIIPALGKTEAQIDSMFIRAAAM